MQLIANALVSCTRRLSGYVRVCWPLAQATLANIFWRIHLSRRLFSFIDEGVPYTLPMPGFAITRSVVNNEIKYKVDVNWVPSPNQRYILRASPSWLADVGFNFDFNPAGAIDNVGLTQKGEVVPTITAVGAFASAILPAAAPATQAGHLTPEEVRRGGAHAHPYSKADTNCRNGE